MNPIHTHYTLLDRVKSHHVYLRLEKKKLEAVSMYKGNMGKQQQNFHRGTLFFNMQNMSWWSNYNNGFPVHNCHCVYISLILATFIHLQSVHSEIFLKGQVLHLCILLKIPLWAEYSYSTWTLHSSRKKFILANQSKPTCLNNTYSYTVLSTSPKWMNNSYSLQLPTYSYVYAFTYYFRPGHEYQALRTLK